MSDITFIDLFCGCGGFSLGLKKAGCKELASIDFNPEAVAVFRANFPEVPFVLEEDLIKFHPEKLAKLIGTNRVDLIVGGPPCQGFSTVRQVDGANSGERLIEDDRRNLFREFLKFVKYFKPKIFVIENVTGIRSAAGGEFFSRVQVEARELGYRVHGEIIRAWEYGVPQKRQRQLIIGTLVNLPLFIGKIHMTPTHMEKFVSLWEAIGDLPPLKAGEGEETTVYDRNRQIKHEEKHGEGYLINVLEIQKAERLTAHRARSHSARDLRDFKKLKEGENSAHAIARGEDLESPYNRDGFKDRYTRQHRNRLCSTIVAHLSKDGLMFIHPTQNRSLTPREAARIQSFPDWFKLPVARTHQFRLIGNAVPPLVGQAVGNGIKGWFDPIDRKVTDGPQNAIPVDEFQAIEWLTEVTNNFQNGNLGKVEKDKFIRAWNAIAFLFSHLHPDSVKDNGKALIQQQSIQFPVMEKEIPHLIRPVYSQSGWPLGLVPMATEARKRFDNGEMTSDEYYFSYVQVTGMQKAGKPGG